MNADIDIYVDVDINVKCWYARLILMCMLMIML